MMLMLLWSVHSGFLSILLVFNRHMLQAKLFALSTVSLDHFHHHHYVPLFIL